MDSFLGSKLRRAREEAGLSQGAFARAVGLSSEYISLLESGKRVPSFDTMKRLSAYLGRDTVFFLAEKKRSLESLLDGDGVPSSLKANMTRFKAYCAKYLKAEEETGRRLELAPSYSRLSAERMAEEERRRLGLGDEPIRDFFSLAEMNGLRILRLPLSDEARVAGVFLFDEETVGAFALLNSQEPSGLQLLAAAHIYGHYLRDRDAGLIVDTLDMVLDEYVSLYPPREQAAQAFALYFLVPPSKLRALVEKDAGPRGLSFDQIILLKRYFGVSSRTVLRALRREKLIGGSRFEEFFKRDPEGREEALFGNASGFEERNRGLRLRKPRSVTSDRYRFIEAEAAWLEKQKCGGPEEKV